MITQIRKFSKIINISLIAILFLSLAGIANAASDTWIKVGDTYYQESAIRQYQSSEDLPCVTRKDQAGGGTIEVVSNDCSSGVFLEMSNLLSSGLNGVEKAQIDPETGEIVGYQMKHGVSGGAIAMGGYLYSEKPIQPASVQAMETFNEVKGKLGVQTTYAQDSSVYFPGVGFNILQPIQSFWGVNRNVAYGLLIIMVMIIALLILFGRQLEGGVAISLLNSLPSIVLSLLLITFSYAYSGLFIDLITVGTNFTQYIFVTSPGAPGYDTIWNGTTKILYEDGLPKLVKLSEEEVRNLATENNLSGVVGEISVLEGRTGIQADDPLMSVWLVFGTADLNLNAEDALGSAIIPDIDVLQTTPLVGGVVNALSGLAPSADQATGGALSSLATSIINLVFSIALFMASIRIFFKLLSAYLTLILFPIVAPYMFLIAALPTMTTRMITNFSLPMLSASLKFITTYAIFLLIVVFTHQPQLQGFNFVPPLLGYDSGSSIYSSGQIVKTLVAYGLFLSTPVILDTISGALQGDGAKVFGDAIVKGTQSSAGNVFGGVQNLFRKLNTSRWPDAK